MKDDLVRSRILEVSRQRFFESGYSKVTMDELAEELGMSKKTLYQHFSGKKALLRAAMIDLFMAIRDEVSRIVHDEDKDFIARLREVGVLVGDRMPRPSPLFMKDIQRYASDVWVEVDQLRSTGVAANFGKLFRDGIREGYLPEELDVDLLIRMLTALIQGLVNPQVLSELPLTGPQMLEQIVTTLMFGVMTEKGRLAHQGRHGLIQGAS